VRQGTEDKAEREVALRDAIERNVLQFPGYDCRRVIKALHRQDWTVNHTRVVRIIMSAISNAAESAFSTEAAGRARAQKFMRTTPRVYFLI
jgi:hypothetical protein